MKVKLLEYTPNGEKLVASAAKLCYSPVGIDEIQEDLSDEEVEKFLGNLINVGHESPIEHISFTFAVEGVSRSLTHQLVRHRIGSYSQKSQRYVEEDGFKYVTPESILKASNKDNYDKPLQQWAGAMARCRRAYEELVKAGVEKEDARYILPNAVETKIVFTMNARTLLHFFRLRACNRAQWEIRELAEKMIEQVKEVYPVIFKNAGPSCITGPCPEGRMTCGKIDEVRKKYE